MSKKEVAKINLEIERNKKHLFKKIIWSLSQTFACVNLHQKNVGD